MEIEIKIGREYQRAVELSIEFIENCIQRCQDDNEAARHKYTNKAVKLVPHAAEMKKFGDIDKTRSYIPHICDVFIDKCAAYRQNRGYDPDTYIKLAVNVLKEVAKLYDYAGYEQMEFAQGNGK